MKKFMKSVALAFSGLYYAVRTQRHMRIHITVALIVILLGAIVSLNKLEWSIILLVIGGVISLELVNTAIESAIDLVQPTQHPLAKIVKDVAASAVLFMSVIAVLIGFIILTPKLYHMLF